ncbi:hypothetical protein TNCV_4608871 [Trichonephila clavipes]|nr:hypothetical protein TNCV_4608871 [Trichonephila clavipes]
MTSNCTSGHQMMHDKLNLCAMVRDVAAQSIPVMHTIRLSSWRMRSVNEVGEISPVGPTFSPAFSDD